ncbi:MAG: hypothetical protein RLY20_1367 [Verrucomicrobiota bacterium]|jgi:hypothetical protein
MGRIRGRAGLRLWSGICHDTSTVNYRLHRHGQEADDISLEELARRRGAGELNGTEMIWREGMSQWEPLDKVLADPPPLPTGPPPLPRHAQKPKRQRWLIITVTILGGLSVLCVVALVLANFARRFSAQVDRAGAGRTDIAMEAARKPVETSTNSITHKEYESRLREFRVRHYLNGYLDHGVRLPAYDAKAVGFITNWINEHHNGPVNTNLPPLNELGDFFANDPNCTDPLLLTIASTEAVEQHEALRRLERAVAAHRTSSYQGYPRLYAAVLLSDQLLVDKKDRQPVLDAEALQYFKQTLTDGLSARDQEDLAENLLYGWAKNFYTRNAEALCEAASNAGESYRWLELVLRGQLEVKQAWAARGGGYVNTVSDTGWRGFSEHLANARKHLTAAWQLHPDSPIAPNLMIYVSLGDSNITEMRNWFDRVTRARVDYPGAWGHMRWGLRPRWYGDYDSMLAFGSTALNTHRFDTDVPRMFFDSVSDLEQEYQLPAGQHLYDRPDIWPKLQEMYEGYIKAASNPESKRAWRSSYAAVAYLAGKMDVARKQLELLQWQPNMHSLAGWGRDLSLLPAEVAARTGSNAAQVGLAESHLDQGRLEAALMLYRELAHATEPNPAARSFVMNRLSTLKVAAAIKGTNQALQHVDILPEDDALSGWRQVHGQFRRLADGSLEVEADQYGHMIYLPVNIGRDFEVEGSFEVVSSSSDAFQAGLVMGLPSWDTATWYSFRIKRNADEGDVASFADGWQKKQLLSPAKLNAGTNTFWMRFSGGKVTAQVNGVLVLNGVKAPKNTAIPEDTFYLGLGAFNDMNRTVIRYHRLRLCKYTIN